jgi:hypothetical protein
VAFSRTNKASDDGAKLTSLHNIISSQAIMATDGRTDGQLSQNADHTYVRFQHIAVGLHVKGILCHKPAAVLTRNSLV